MVSLFRVWNKEKKGVRATGQGNAARAPEALALASAAPPRGRPGSRRGQLCSDIQGAFRRLERRAG